jgi:hypothetical protein
MYPDNVTFKKISQLITDMAWNGIARSLEQTHILKCEHGIEVAPHILAEFKYHKRKKGLKENHIP